MDDVTNQKSSTSKYITDWNADITGIGSRSLKNLDYICVKVFKSSSDTDIEA